MNRRLYAAHRWLSAITFLQLAIWTISGSFFALVPIQRVRGGFVEGAHDAPLPAALGVLSPATILAQAAAAGLTGARVVEMRASSSGEVWYVVRKGHAAVRFDARTGAPAPVTAAEAQAIARRDQAGPPEVESATLVDVAEIEYRDKPVPAWRVVLQDGRGTAVYVDARTGEVTARRNDVWRIYDWLWSLHIMDYRGREDFNHPLIMVAAGLAVLTVLSGLVLWSLRLSRWWKARRATA